MGKKLLKTHKVDFKDDEVRFQWFSIVTMYNHERKVADMLRKRFDSMGASNKLKEVFVPIREWEEETLGKIKKDGTRTKRKVKKSENVLESGYIFINMIMDNDTWNIVRQTTGVAGWLNMDGRPSDVPAEDILKWKNILSEGNNEATQQLIKDFGGKIGDKARITEGPFKDLTGEIVDINELNVSLIVDTMNGASIEISAINLEVI